MAEAELEIAKLTVSELLAVAAGVATALKNNIHFPAPQPPPEELERLISELEKAEEAYRQQRRLMTEVQAARDAMAETLREAMQREVAYVQAASEGDLAKILSASLHVEEETHLWPFRGAGDVTELNARVGDEPGEIDLAWDRVQGAAGYEVEMTSDFSGEEEWEQVCATTKSKFTVERLVSRTRYCFRVRALNEGGAGEWSPQVMKFAP